MSHPDPPQQPQWQPQQPGPGTPPGPGAAPGQPRGPVPGQPQGPMPGQPQGPMPGHPQFPGGPGGPGGPPPGGQFSGGHVPPSGGGGRKWLIPSAAVVAVALMAGTVWATTSLVSFGGAQPETVLPGNSVAFGKVDLSIDGSQAIELLSFIDQLPAEISEEFGDAEEDTTELFADTFVEAFPDADKGSVEEWIGERVGMAVWPTGNEAASEGTGVAFAIALAVDNERLAEEDFSTLSAEEQMDYEVIDDFVLISASGDMLHDLEDQTDEHGTLDSADLFDADMEEVPSGSLASAWVDLAGLMEVEDVAREVEAEVGTGGIDMAGRMTASLRVDGDYLEVRSDLVEFEADGEDLSWLDNATGESIEGLGQLPESTVAALAGSGLDEALTSAHENGDLDFVLDDYGFQEMESDLQSIGAPLPEGFGSLLGSTTAYGVTSMDSNDFFESSGDHSFEYRADGADEDVLNSFVEEGATDPFAQQPGVSADGDTVVVSRGSTSTAPLADDSVFQQTMEGMDDAIVAGYFDLRQTLEQGADAADPEEWGALGFGIHVTEEGDRVSGELRWSPSGGE